MSIDGWMDKETVARTCNGMLFSLKKEGNPTTCNNMDESAGYYAKWNKPATEHDSTQEKQRIDRWLPGAEER